MGYDTDVHIPGQVDHLLMSFNHKDLDGINLSLDNLLTLVKDNGFKHDLKGYEADYKLEQKKIDDETLRGLHSCKTIDEAIKTISENKNRFDNLQYEYISIIRTYIITYFKKTGDVENNQVLDETER